MAWLRAAFFSSVPFWQAEGIHDAVEGLGVLIDEVQGAADDILTTVCPLRELLPTLVPSTLVGGEVGHHRAQGSSERTHVGGDRATTRCWTLAGSLVGKFAHREIDELRRLVLILQKILDDLLSRVEGL